MGKFTALIAPAFVVLLLAAACGGGGEETQEPTQEPEDTVPAEETQEPTQEPEDTEPAEETQEPEDTEPAAEPLPAGGRIAFADNTGIFIIPAAGGVLERLTEESESDPAWSPDGKQIAFTSSQGLFVIKADGTELRPVVGTAGANWPTWSKDGAKIAYVDRSTRELFVIGIDGTDKVLLVTSASQPAWSPLCSLRFLLSAK